MLPHLAGHPAFCHPLWAGLLEQGMEEGRQRKQELEQPAHWVLSQTLRTHLSVTGYSKSQNRWPCLLLVPSITLWSLGGPYRKKPVCALGTPAAMSTSPVISEAKLPTEGSLSIL